jgi:tetratricopeptide (TPR) repeat protein
MNKICYIAILFSLFVVQVVPSCLFSSPENRMQKFAEMHEQKKIDNPQMLFEMGKIFLKNPENTFVKNEYFQRMIVSGYSSHVLHYFLLSPQKKLENDDMKTILFALQKGKHYNLATEFKDRLEGEFSVKLEQFSEVMDTLECYNQQIKDNPNGASFAQRGKFFTKLGEQDLANRDLDQSMRLYPCNPDALFQKIMNHFNSENTREIISLLDKCENRINSKSPVWKSTFYELAKNIEEVEQSNEAREGKLFRKANLYVNNGFPEIALRNSQELLKMRNNNADYLALQAFIYYRMNQKSQALKYITEAEQITGKSSKLKELIADMN